MDLAKLLDKLGYADSPHFLRRGSAALRNAPEFGHIFRNASRRPCNLEGVYTLQRDPHSKSEPLVPVVYVCRAESEEAASNVHKLVWNQDVVPFLFVNSPNAIRLYSGFRCQPQKGGIERGVLRTLTQFNELSDLAESFHADAIDCGKLWRKWGKQVTTETRVDRKLLGNLKNLDHWLQSQGGLDRDVSHALIGKYVYLHYLRDREVLSDTRLAEWNLDESTIFGQNATRAGLLAVTEQLDVWLNGSVFPLKLRGPKAPDEELIRRVAATFHGDQIASDRTWQLHLDFQAYDFSYIPIETLSVIYEQFLHLPGKAGQKTKGEEAAAYYTPIPVVNFMLSEMDEQLPLKRGMKVFDPACGSGAFLVQSYRRLVEREFPATKKKPTPQQLRDLLEGHIFGVDNDSDACRVTELSLVLTLLDYVDPPDLMPEKATRAEQSFKLPTLCDTNIFHTNFFQVRGPAKQLLNKTHFDWIVGNPPWKGLDPKKLIEQDEPVWKWMQNPENKTLRPCGDNEVAQAFAWRVADVLSDNGVAALLLPAMTLFEDPSRRFRGQFFDSQKVTAVANFANLAEVLFAGRSRIPAAAYFFGRHNPSQVRIPDEFITVFSPLVANQEITRPESSGVRITTWSLAITANEIRDLPLADVISGDGLPWKIATWGTSRDEQLITKVRRNPQTLGKLEKAELLVISEGLQLRKKLLEGEGVEPIPEVRGKSILSVSDLSRLRYVFTFPHAAISVVSPELAFCREGRKELPLSVCRPPHIIVSAARNFAVYSPEYLIVPPRQIGIVSTTNNAPFLKALSLYLSSDFAYYHQFLTATQFGVQRGVATLNALRSIPIPIASYTEAELKPWVELHSQLVKTTPLDVRETQKQTASTQRNLYDDEAVDRKPLLEELNKLVFDSLRLNAGERALVHDLVHIRLALNDGKVGRPAVRQPTLAELSTYARRLKSELDAFIDDELEKWHQVGIIFDKSTGTGMVQVDLIADRSSARELVVSPADNPTAKQLEKTRHRLRKQHSQWVYFDRNLRIYEGSKTFVFKPLQRFHWTESQAMFDASEIISETLQLGDDAP